MEREKKELEKNRYLVGEVSHEVLCKAAASLCVNLDQGHPNEGMLYISNCYEFGADRRHDGLGEPIDFIKDIGFAHSDPDVSGYYGYKYPENPDAHVVWVSGSSGFSATAHPIGDRQWLIVIHVPADWDIKKKISAYVRIFRPLEGYYET
jgi:hypothetical protein